ncbi:MAG: DnaJ domain-containing protein [Cytophagaceae bacterium]
MQTYYSILGVPTSASTDDIKKAFKSLAKAHHPDKNPGSTYHDEKFKLINEAYQVLSDPVKKSKYDAYILYGNTTNYTHQRTTQTNQQTTYKRPKRDPKVVEEERKLKRKYYFFTALFAVGITVFGTFFYYFMNKYTAKTYYEKGLKFEQLGNYSYALQAYLASLQQYEDFPEANEKLGDMILINSKDHDKASYYFIKAYSLYESPKDKKRSLYKNIESLTLSNRYYDADVALTKASSISDTESYKDSLLFLLAQNYSKKKDTDKALPLLEKLVAKDSLNYNVQLMIAQNYLYKHDTLGAIIQLATIKNNFPDKGAPYYYSGYLYIFKKNYPLACKEFEIGYSLDNDLPTRPFDIYCE